MFRQTHLVPAGAQVWMSQVVSARGTRFVYASTLALYAHDRDDYSLSSIPVTQTETLSAFDWRVSINGNETDAFLVCTNDDVIRVYTSGDGGTGSSPTLTHTMKFQSFGVRFVSWDQHRGDVFLVVAGNSLYKVTLNGNGTSATTTKQPWPNQGVVTCFTRHPSNNRQCAVGTKTGSAWLFDAESGRSVPLSRLFQGEIADVQFDPKSNDYLLVATLGGVITLWNVDGSGDAGGMSTSHKPSQVMEFAKQQTGVCACLFVPSAPGTFLTASTKHGVLRLWNVSNENPIHVVNCKEGGVTSACALADDSGRVVVSFRSGDVGVFDTKHRRRVWAKGPGHTETVFACVYNPANPNQVVSCSFDGTVRLWNALDRSCQHTFLTADAPRRFAVLSGSDAQQRGSGSGNADESFGGGPHTHEPGKGSLYTCAVSCDGAVVCAAGFEGDLYFWDVLAKRALPVINIAPPRTGCVHKVVSHPTKPGVFACASLDGRAHILRFSGEIIASIQHHSPVCGVAFDPFDERVLATATADAWVGVHGSVAGSEFGSFATHSLALTSSGDSKYVTTKLGVPEGGHTSKVYGVLFSPLVKGRLLSVSDDCTARVWSLAERPGGAFVCSAKTVVLTGHINKVRAQNWHPEIANVCFTGSWDGSIRCWDAVLGLCLHVTTTHAADVYDIGVHAARPFRAVTCSRDTTMRFWSTEGMAPSAKLLAVMGGEVSGARVVGVTSHGDEPSRRDGEDGFGDPTEDSRCFSRDARVLQRTLSGPAVGGGGLARAVATSPTLAHRYGHVFEALSGHASSEEMWRLALIEASGPGEARGLEDAANGAVSTPHVCEARVLVEARTSTGASGESSGRGDRKSRRDTESDARENASVRLRCGDARGYCEAMRLLGDWNAAIAAAPAVSLPYWASLAAQRADEIVRDGGDAEEQSRLLLVAGKPQEAAAALCAAGREDDAFVVACAAADGGFPGFATDDAHSKPFAIAGNTHRASETADSDGDRPHERHHVSPSALHSSHDDVPGAPALSRKKSASVDFGDDEVSGTKPGIAGKIAPLSPLGVSRSGSSLASLSPLPPLRVAGKMKALAAKARGASLETTATETQAVSRSPKPRAKSLPAPVSNESNASPAMRLIRGSQASRRLAHGDAVGAASCFLSISDTIGATKALLRGGQIEMAAALMLSLPKDKFPGVAGTSGRDNAHALLAALACEFGEWDFALTAASAIVDRDDRSWRSRLVLAKRLAVDAEGCARERFAEKCALSFCPEKSGERSDAANAAVAAVAAATAGDLQAAAECAVAAAAFEIAKTDLVVGETGKFDSAPGTQAWDAMGLRMLCAAFDVVSRGGNADAYDPKLRMEVTTFRCYLSALVLQSAGYTPAQRSLFHHARSSLRATKGFTQFPHIAAFVSLQELGAMAGTYPVDAARGFREISNAPSVDPALRKVASEGLDEIAKRKDVKDKAPPPLAALGLDSKYNGVVDWSVADKMPMEDAARAALFWDAAGLADDGAFKPPV